MTRRFHRLPCVSFVALLAFTIASGQPVGGQQPAPAKGTLERITVHGRALEGNLEGDSPDRAVVVYLPPSYTRDTNRRYPVLYFLHGYTATAEAYVKSLAIPDSIDRAIAAGAREMIVVIPDAFTKYSGSMFSNSPTTGFWETYVADDLTAYIDTRYRTIASKEGRGLAGHSMGGYGTMRIGMKQPHAFGALYAMSSCCLMNDPAAGRGGAAGRGDAGRGAPQGRGAGQGAGQGRGGGMANALSAQAAAWAPNPKNPPQFFDLPTKDGEIQPHVAAKWVANSPLVFVDQYVPSLRSMRAIALDIGDRDPFLTTNRQLADALTRLDAPHAFEVYEGDHGNRIRERFEMHVLPFFSRHLTAPEIAERSNGVAESPTGSEDMTARIVRTIAASLVTISASMHFAGLPRLAAAQTSRDGAWTGRTLWGDPDLQGEWTAEGEYGVPFERPPQFGMRQFLTDEEYSKRLEDARICDERDLAPVDVLSGKVDAPNAGSASDASCTAEAFQTRCFQPSTTPISASSRHPASSRTPSGRSSLACASRTAASS